MKILFQRVYLLLPAAVALGAAIGAQSRSSAFAARPETSTAMRTEQKRISHLVSGPAVGLTDQMRANIAESQRRLNIAQEMIAGRSDSAGRVFRTLAGEIALIRSRLDKSLRRAETASVGEWEDASSRLAAEYETYVLAVAEAQRLAGTRTPLREDEDDF